MRPFEFKNEYWDGRVQISEDVYYDQREVIEDNFKSINGYFENNYFTDGTKKLYYNVVMGFAQTLKKGSRLKLSEFSLTSLNGKYLKLLDLFKGAVKHFLKYNGWTDKKEEVLSELVDMGHVVTKIVDGETYVVDLRRLIFKPDAVSLKYEGCMEEIPYTYEEMKAEFGDNDNWEEIEHYYKGIKNTTNELKVLEYWTVDEFENEKGEKEITKGCIKILDRSDSRPDNERSPEEWDLSLELGRFISPHKIKVRNKREKRIYGDEMRVFPYDEQRLIPVRGRYMGMGAYELCRPASEDYQEKRNFKRKFDRLSLRGILVHKIGNMRQDSDGEALTQEFLKRMDTGAALKIFKDESLERLNIGSTTGDTLAMTNDLFEFMRFLLGVTPVAIGNTTQNKTASFAVIQNQNQQSTYQVIKNKCARLYERLFQDFLLEDIIEDIISGDTISIYADKEDLEEMDRFLVKTEVDEKLNIMRPNINEDIYMKVIKDRADSQKEFGLQRHIEMPEKSVKRAFKKLLKQLEYIVEFNITDDAIDPNVKIKTLIEADKMENERLRDLALDQVGISPKLLKETEEEKRARLEETVRQERALTEARQPAPQLEQPIMPPTLNNSL